MAQRPPVVDLSRAGVATLPLYRTDAATCAIDLSDNTNLWGAPPAAASAIRDNVNGVARYPSLYSEPLREMLLDYVGVGTDTSHDTVTGCGSDDVLDSTMRAFNGNGASIAFSAPTFSMIPVLAQLNGLEPITIPFTACLDIDAEQLVDARATITYLCTPNNPTGTAASRGAVEFVVRHAVGIVLLDEAYAEFAPETFAHLVMENDRVIVTRTFSKAFGLAGLRVGFGVGARETVRLVARARGPYKVNVLAERAVRAALSHGSDGREWVRLHAQHAVANRDRLIAALSARGISTLPSAANFVLVPLARAVGVARALVDRGILVRVVSGLPTEHPAFSNSDGTGLRIGVGPWPMMQSLLDALDGIL